MFVNSISKAQTTAMDFTKMDCAGQNHQLFSELDSGNLVIMEFIMTCNSCIAAGHALETMVANLQAEYPNRVRWYQMAYTNSYTCASMTAWKNTNGFTSAVFDQGAALVAYYGGFGMPTVAVAAGSGHDVLFSNVGFSISDTTAIGIAARNFFATSSTVELPSSIQSFRAYPSPANTSLSVSLNLNESGELMIQLVDLSGKEIMKAAAEPVSKGVVERNLDVSNVASGIYLVKATINGKSVIERIKISH